MADWMLDPPEDDWDDEVDEDFEEVYDEDEVAADAASDWENERDRY